MDITENELNDKLIVYKTQTLGFANGEKVETKIYPCCKRGIFSLHGCALHVEIRGEAYASPFFELFCLKIVCNHFTFFYV